MTYPRVYRGTYDEHHLVAVPDFRGRALCISFDKGWTFTREWEEIEDLEQLIPISENAKVRVRLAEQNQDLYDKVRAIETATPVDSVNPGDLERVLSDVYEDAECEWPGTVSLVLAVMNYLRGVGIPVDDPDPVLYEIRESDVKAISITSDGMDEFIPSTGGWYGDTPGACKDSVHKHLLLAATAEAVARAMEEQALDDLVIEKARELTPILFPGREFDGLPEVGADTVMRAAEYILNEYDDGDDDS